VAPLSQWNQAGCASDLRNNKGTSNPEGFLSAGGIRTFVLAPNLGYLPAHAACKRAKEPVCSQASPEQIRQAARKRGGHATLFRGSGRQGEVFAPLSPAMKHVHKRLKQALPTPDLQSRVHVFLSLTLNSFELGHFLKINNLNYRLPYHLKRTNGQRAVSRGGGK
jgi:hypothetical protein